MDKIAKLSRQRILDAAQVWEAFSQLSYKNNKGSHAIIRNIDKSESMAKAIQKNLEKIRDKFIKKDSKASPKKLYQMVDDPDTGLSVRKPDSNGNDTAIGWDWKKNGRQDCIDEQNEYLEEDDEIPFYPMQKSQLTPCWRYVTDQPGIPAKREELYHSPADIRRIEYAFVVATETKEGEKNGK